MPHRLRNLILTLLGLALIAPMAAACADDGNAGFRCPAPITSPVDGRQYTPWVENPHETDGCPYAPAAFAMPYDRPVQSPGMSTTDFLLLMMLFDNHTTYGPSFYDRPDYYNSRIAPAWSHYPGTYSAGPGGRITVHSTTVNNYGNATKGFEVSHAADIQRNAGKQTYVDAKGKTYSGKDALPSSAFKGTNVTPTGPAGDTPRGKNGTQTGPNATRTGTGSNNTNTGKGYSGTQSGRSGGSPPSSGRSGGSSSSGRSGK